MLIDTDVIIWNLRGDARAGDLLDQNRGFCISAVTYMELMQGVRDGGELRLLRKAMQHWRTVVQPLTSEVSHRAMFLVETYTLSHGVQMADALIAATALSLGDVLVTANDKHYRMIEGLEIEVFRPSRSG
jgi:predicted nucleic acid-binding protein